MTTPKMIAICVVLVAIIISVILATIFEVYDHRKKRPPK